MKLNLLNYILFLNNKVFLKKNFFLRKIDSEKVAILVDMFYLPFEHGVRGQKFLQEFQWLHEKSHFLNLTNLEEQNEWLKRFKDFEDMFNQFNCLYKLIIDSPNKVKKNL